MTGVLKRLWKEKREFQVFEERRRELAVIDLLLSGKHEQAFVKKLKTKRCVKFWKVEWTGYGFQA